MISLHIMTPGFIRDEEADAVFLPGDSCPFEVLEGHAPIISALSAGTVRWRKGAAENCLEVKGGVVRLQNDVMELCVQI